jgi:hypothetical protein
VFRFAPLSAMVESLVIYAEGRWMPSNSRRIPGLLLRGAVWHIDKVIYGKRICESPSSVFKRERVAWSVSRGTAQSFLALRALQSIVRTW